MSSMASSSAPISLSLPKLLLSKTRRAMAAGFTPASTAWRQMSKVRGVMFEWWNEPGVGQDREVDVRGDLAAERHAERADHVEHHLAARRRRLVEPVQRAVHPVAGVVVDVDDEVAVEAGDAGPAEVAALHHDEGIGLGVAPARDLDPVDARELAIVVRRGVGVDEPHLLAERLEGVGHGQLGSDRVAVGTRVRRQQKPLAPANRLADRRHDIGARRGVARG